jgi:3-phenylpropionate/trans-cinnamate dioxygenase ferredoxin subunit
MPDGAAVCRVEDVPARGCRMVEVENHAVGVFNVNGEYVAVGDVCPHALAPVCQGRHGGTTLQSAPGQFRWGREGEILACPWHGWEFDLTTGRALADPHRRLQLYSVVRQGDELVIRTRSSRRRAERDAGHVDARS